MKYKNQERYAEEDAELERLEAEYRKQYGEEAPEDEEENTPLDTPKDLDKPLDKEEETWKKRHSDLRSYSQRQLNEKEKLLAEEAQKVKDLQKQLEQKEKEMKFPANKQEAEDWVKDYPDLARVIGTLIDERAGSVVAGVTDEVKEARMQLEAERSAIARERAFAEVMKAHPDFDKLIQDPDFQSWVEEQPKVKGSVGQALYDALYKNDTDSFSAIQAVNVYKQDKAGSSKSKKESNKDAAYAVKKSAVPEPSSSDGKRKFTESEIEKMDRWTYEKLEDEIETARREGRIVYDLSGAAR